MWSAVRNEGLFRSDDDGRTWTLADFAGQDVTAIAELNSGLVLMATARQAEYRSEDGGDTWALVEVLRMSADQGLDGAQFFDFIQGPDGSVYMLCWAGLARSEDGGLTYSFYNTERPQNTHSVALTRDEDGSMAAWVGTYGSGPLLTGIASGASTVFPSLIQRFTRSSPVSRDWAEDGIAIFDEGYSTWRTKDGGVTWVEVASNPIDHGDVTLEEDVKGVALSPTPAEDPFLLAIVGDTEMTFQSSEDLGDTWTTGSQEPACERDGFAVALSTRWPGESRAWAACGGALYESVDRGQAWAMIADTSASFIFSIVERWDGALLVATSDGLWLVDGASTTQVGFAGAVVDSVAASVEEGERTAFALVPASGWFRSDDGGTTWIALRAPTADLPRMVAMSPTFVADGMVAVAGYGGAWASNDRGETWFSIYGTELFESNLDTWRTTGTWENPLAPESSAGEFTWTDQVGASKTLEFRGVAVAIEAPTDAASGGALITLDSREAQLVALPGSSSTLWEAAELEDTWHTLRIEAFAGITTLDVVSVDRLGAPEVDPMDEPEPVSAPPPCGCEGGGASAPRFFWVAVVFLHLSRRVRW